MQNFYFSDRKPRCEKADVQEMKIILNESQNSESTRNQWDCEWSAIEGVANKNVLENG